MKGRTNAVASVATEPKYWQTTIEINQSVTDPATMITLVSDDGGIAKIREHSHRYVGKVVDGVFTARQLQDTNGTLYLDGTPADLTGGEGDVFMKLPNFFYRAWSASSKFYVRFGYGDMPADQDFKVWGGHNFIGVYEAYVKDEKAYSISGVISSSSITQSEFKQYARNRGSGYTLVKWDHHCMMAFLFFAYYLNTNSQAVCGTGGPGYVGHTRATGKTDLLGMEDTVAGVNGDGFDMSINFWGLENWWGDRSEFIDNATFKSTTSLQISESSGLTRLITLTSSNGWIKELALGANLDVAPKVAGASATTSFCDFFYAGSTGKVLLRSYDEDSSNGGITHLQATTTSATSVAWTSRLCYSGTYKIIE